jgi:hypothetical protein
MFWLLRQQNNPDYNKGTMIEIVVPIPSLLSSVSSPPIN